MFLKIITIPRTSFTRLANSIAFLMSFSDFIRLQAAVATASQIIALLANIVTAVTAAMADAVSENISGGNDDGVTIVFGLTSSGGTPETWTDCNVATVGATTYTVGQYLAGGYTSVAGGYNIKIDGTVTQIYYP